MRRAVVLALVTCVSRAPSRSPSPSLANRTATPSGTSPRVGVIEGTLVDATTHERLPGVTILIGRCLHDREVEMETSDENGHFTEQLAPGCYEVGASVDTSDFERKLDVVAGEVSTLDMEFAHDAVVAARQDARPENCPSSAPGTVIDGHSTTQHDLDEVARAVLTRFNADSTTMMDGGLLPAGDTRVRLELFRPKASLTAQALPPSAAGRFVGVSQADLQAEADRTQADVFFVRFSTIYSDGSCALVHAGVDFIAPSSHRDVKLCCCSARDVYENRHNAWTFVRRTLRICS